MSVTSLYSLEVAIIKHVAAIVANGALETFVQYPNGPEPKIKEPVWFSVFINHGEAVRVTMGAQQTVRYVGVLTLNFFGPVMTGVKDILGAVDILDAGLSGVEANGVQYYTPSITNRTESTGWNQVTLTCPFYADRLV